MKRGFSFLFLPFILAAFLFAAAAEEAGACSGGAHSWAEREVRSASCTAEGAGVKTCSACGAQEEYVIPRVDHSYSGVWVVSASASCVSAGERSMACAVCGGGEVYQTIPAAGHAFESSTQAAACTQDGKIIRRCGNCGATEEERIPAPGHDIVIDPGRAANCTESGLTEGKHCAACGQVFAAQERIPALSHQMEALPGAAPGCVSPGRAEGMRCRRCGYETGGGVIPALGHRDRGEGNGRPAACTEGGLTESRRCMVCGVLTAGQRAIAPAGHRMATDAAVAPTQTEPGLTEGAHCAVCGLVMQAQESIPALGVPSAPLGGMERLLLLLQAWEGAAEEGCILEIAPRGSMPGMQVYYRQDLQYAALQAATAFTEAPAPDFSALLSVGDVSAMAEDAQYGAFLRQARLLFLAAEPGLDEGAADALLLSALEQPLEALDAAALFPVFARGGLGNAPEVIRRGAYEYVLATDGINLFLMLRGLPE